MKQLLVLLTIALSPALCLAQAQEKKMEYNVRAGFSIGAASPIGIPETIRKIESYNPGLQLSLEAGGIYHFTKEWGLASGVRFEQKGMTTKAQVKGYYTTFNAGSTSGAESITGYFTGEVTTKVRNNYLTIPIQAVYRFDAPVSLRFGGFASYALERNFTGSAENGYLRDKTPVGEKEEIEEAFYDFSSDVRKFNAGLEAGVDFHIHSHLAGSVSGSWALTPLMASDFQSINFKLYNLFVNVGLVYKLNKH